MPDASPSTFALVGPGRAGGALQRVLEGAGWRCSAIVGRGAAIPDTVARASLVVVATPDAAVGAALDGVLPHVRPGALVVHCSGALGPAVFGDRARRFPGVELGVLHPLQSLPSAEVGAARIPGSWCAVWGPDRVGALAENLGMHPFPVSRWVEYHAAACVASNHVVALLGQVERLAEAAGVPYEAMAPLVRATVDNVAALGARAALTGPVARGDAATVRAHLQALAEAERPTYRALAAEAARLAGTEVRW